MRRPDPAGPARPDGKALRAELLGSPVFRWFLAARFNVLMVQRILAVTVGWHVYEISGRALDLALVGVAMFVPVPLFIMIAGDVGDRFNRAAVVSIAFGAMAAISAGFLAVAALPEPDVAHLLALTFLFGTSLIFLRPMLTAMVTRVSTARTLPLAIAMSAMAGQGTTIVGPAVAGVLLLSGAATAYGATLLLALLGTVSALRLDSAVIHAQSDKISGAAEREILRRQQAVELAEENIIKGDELMEKMDYEGPVSPDRGAVEMLPDAPISQ